MAKRGRPPLNLVTAAATRARYDELRAEGMGVAEAEKALLDVYPHLTSRQAIRKRRTRADDNETELLFMGFVALAVLADMDGAARDGSLDLFQVRRKPQRF